MKKLLLTLIVVLAYFSSAFAQDWVGVNPNNYESHWTFNWYDYNSQVPFVCAITIDGQVVSLNTENWSDLEVAAFVTTDDGQEECRGNMMWLTDEFVLEYDDPFLTIDGYPIYYNTPGGTVHFKMYDHANNIEYTECTVTYLGDPYTVTAGIGVVHGWGDGLEPVMLNFTTPEPQYESHWPDFDYTAFSSQEPLVAAITIDGQVVTLNTENWSDLEVAAFVTTDDGQEECRGNMMWLTDEFVLEYDDPFLTIDGYPIYYNTPGGTVHFKMYDHANNIEYTECTVTYLGEPHVILTGEENVQGWYDPENPIILHFTTCLKPTELTASNVGFTSVDLNWTENGTATEWQISLNGDTNNLVTANSYPFTLTDLIPGTAYTAKVRANCGDSHSGWSNTVTFTTICHVTVTTLDTVVCAAELPIIWNGLEIFEEGGYTVTLTSANGCDSTVTMNLSTMHILLPYFEDFESYTESTTAATGIEPTCWELVRTDAPSMPNDKRPQVYYRSDFAHSGGYSLLLNYRCVYAMPALSEGTTLQNVKLDMYLRQANAAYQLEVGVWDDATNTFTPVALFNNTTTGVEHVTCNFSGYSGNGRRIAFRNVLGGGATYNYSYNYIDDIKIYTDTIVSMEPSNRNVLLEVFTGHNVQYCPDGHRIANEVKAAHPDRVCVINIHQGYYADNTYTTAFGDALAQQSGLMGFPTGTINRHVFADSVTSLSRGVWPQYANQMLNTPSPVNIAAVGTLDMSTRKLTVRVQLYYTGSQSVTSNALNIAVLQDHVLGHQAGMDFNPDQIVGDQYSHMHMLRHLIAGQWGETIYNIAQGSLVEKTYEYVIPDQLGSPNPIAAMLEDLKFVAFVSEGHQEVLTCVEVPVSRFNVPAIAGYITRVNEIPNLTCSAQTDAEFEFLNQGSDPVTSLTYTYSIGGATQAASWNGNVGSYERTMIHIPTFDIEPNIDDTLTVQVTKINGMDVDVSPKTLAMRKNIYSGRGTMLLTIVTDRYGNETTFNIFDSDGNVVLSGGPWSDLGTHDTMSHEILFEPQSAGCYRLEVYDEYGDGINSGYGEGYITMTQVQDGVQLFYNDGKFGKQATYMIDITSVVNCEPITLPYSENFDNYTTSTTTTTGVEPECWELVQMDVQAMTDANRPQIFYKSAYAHSGAYSLLLNYRGVYAMPMLGEDIFVNRLGMSFYLRQPKSFYRLQVGVVNADGEFELVEEINNASTGVEYVTVDFSNYTGQGRRIAFRNVLGGGATYNYSYNYIDDIKIYTDTIVSMEPSNRNVLLEVFTGHNVQYCPDGHRIANEVKAAHPDRVCVINIHQGYYADNTYTTAFGDALAQQSGLMGFPTGTINRHVFADSVTSLSRGVWPQYANQMLNTPSPVNIAAVGTLDMSTRKLTVRVQLYYTGSQSVTSNALNIAVLQDHVLGHQAGMDFNPDQIVGDQYSHMHMLRHLIAGQWGETIYNIAQGSLVEKTYEYVIPDQLGSPNPIAAMLEDLKFVAFVSEGHQEVLTCVEVPVSRFNVPAIAGYITRVNEIPNLTCSAQTDAEFEFLNQGSDPVTSLTYTYSIGGATQAASWNGNVGSYERTMIHIPTFDIEPNIDDTLTVQVTKINGMDVDVSPKTLAMRKNIYSGSGAMLLTIVTDRYGSETTFNIFDSDGNVVLSGGPWSDLGSNDTMSHEILFEPQSEGCYRLEVYDGYGDGINSGYGEGCFTMTQVQDGMQLFYDDGKFGKKVTYMIDITSVVNCEPITLPYSENFDNYTTSTTTTTGVEPECWELVQMDVQAMTDANRPQIYYKSTYAHSGAYSLLLNYRGVYAMPELSSETQIPLNRVKLEMYLRQPKAAYQLQVGVWDGQQFEPVATFNNSGTGVEYVTCDFSNYNGNGRRIAFRNVLGDGANYNYSYNYIDDITLTEISEQVCGITLPYSENFDSYTTSTTTTTGAEPECWELVQAEVQGMTDANRPQIYYKSTYANSGAYSLLLNYRGVYAMPELSWETQIPLNRVKLEMYLRQPKAAYQLQVGVWDGQLFEPVATFNNSGTGVEYVTCDFSNYNGNGRRIAFRNVLGGGATYNYSYNYIDDIVLTEIEECAVTLPYTETFESYTESTTASTGVEPDCWELVREDVAMTETSRPQLYYRSSFAHSGSYSLKMGNRCVYAMPALSQNIPLNQITLDMYLRQANAAYRLEVGVWDDEAQTFEAMQLFNNSTTNVEHVTCDFSNYNGNGRRIAFRNVLGGGANYAYSYNYLDDITLTVTANKSAEVTNANATDAGMMAADRDQVDVVVYPNPTKDVVNVECTMNNVQCSGIEVIDVYGKIVTTVDQSTVSNQIPTQINVSGLAAGMYFVRVTTDKGVVTKPFVKR